MSWSRALLIYSLPAPATYSFPCPDPRKSLAAGIQCAVPAVCPHYWRGEQTGYSSITHSTQYHILYTDPDTLHRITTPYHYILSLHRITTPYHCTVLLHLITAPYHCTRHSTLHNTHYTTSYTLHCTRHYILTSHWLLQQAISYSPVPYYTLNYTNNFNLQPKLQNALSVLRSKLDKIPLH